ncbi:uncharacterized protein LOC122243817 isoform X2 [Penaeus japonicus]|uniref:uncharacterized protein LOC122243817 isoform X2 n=1 Tax=Penaeus japonicus TaxID=27405 RepID=UPI001C715618|nr:uncharacterized protein LOC122243817 isoform X2 [Penaeus japonicus]
MGKKRLPRSGNRNPYQSQNFRITECFAPHEKNPGNSRHSQNPIDIVDATGNVDSASVQIKQHAHLGPNRQSSCDRKDGLDEENCHVISDYKEAKVKSSGDENCDSDSRGFWDKNHDVSSQQDQGRGHRDEHHGSDSSGQGRGHRDEHHGSDSSGQGRGHRDEHHGSDSSAKGLGHRDEHHGSDSSAKGLGHRDEHHGSDSSAKGLGHRDEHHGSDSSGQGRGYRDEHHGNDSSAKGLGHRDEHHGSDSSGKGRGHRDEHRDSDSSRQGRRHWDKNRDVSSQQILGRGHQDEFHNSDSSRQGQARRHGEEYHQQGQRRGQHYIPKKVPKQDYRKEQVVPKTRGYEEIKESLRCCVCHQSYNGAARKPKCLICGHTICLMCACYLHRRSHINCPMCKRRTNISSADALQDNVTLSAVIKTVQTEVAPKRKAPHGSRCFEQGIQPTHYCSKCHLWLCIACGNADHSSGNCKVITVREAIESFKRQCETDAAATNSNVSTILQEVTSYQNILESCLFVMRASFESFEGEQASAQLTLEEGRRRLGKLKDVVDSFPEDGDIVKFQSYSKEVHDQCTNIDNWSSSQIEKIKFLDDFFKISRKMFNLNAYLHANSSSATPPLLVKVRTAKGARYGRLVAEGGRVHVHSVESYSSVNDTRAIPMDSVKALMDLSSVLLFLDLNWGGRVQGRVYIRLLGDTIRGRLFKTLCLGDLGPTLKNTGFHRVWWLNLEGEHIWGGDCDQGDGSGGAAFFASTQEPQAAAPPRPISEGLVAGRYEKEGISTIFRIYTKSAKDATEEAAFGLVEHGLDTVAKAMRADDLRGVKIADCGMVIEEA